MPTSSASAMPSANERSEIIAAALNFAVGMIVIAAAITPENGGTMVDSFARPTISQTMNHDQQRKENRNFLPNRIIVVPNFRLHWKAESKCKPDEARGGAGQTYIVVLEDCCQNVCVQVS